MKQDIASNIKIVIIGFYYGKFPSWLQYWLRSCADNPTIDFIIVTDIELRCIPDNIKIIKLTLSEVKILFEKKLGMKVQLESAYKLCDFRPLYGYILNDYIQEYDYWGHCDFDLIWGDIRTFIIKYRIEKYDKFLPLGHLSLYKNDENVNHYYKLKGSKCGNYKTVLSSKDNFAFDELGGIYAIYEYNKLPMFTKRIFAEIKTFHKRFRLKTCDKNYKHQVFYYEKGKVYRAYLKKNNIEVEDYIYIHFRRKLSVNEKVNWKDLKAFYITPNGFFYKKEGIKPTVEDIERYNHNPGFYIEACETLLFCLKNIKKIGVKIENEIITLRGNR